jgi:hypothetical protein
MVIGGGVGWYILQPLTTLAVFVIILLFLIRGAVIRLSS